jgi:hypothetical protein
VNAARRLDQAHEQKQRLEERLAASVGSAAEPEAARELDAANAEVGARKAWLGWADRTPDW